ncbi:MAG: hypothetical protein OEV21_07280 [Thermoplasmata archaeon]|nr:hypothetical protein [Thermoplasmata archaeon]
MVSIEEFTEFVKKKYNSIPTSRNERMIRHSHKLLTIGLDPHTTLDSFLNEIAMTICRHLGFMVGSIALIDPKDGKFRYVATVGLRKEAEEALKKMEYSLEVANDLQKYPRIILSKTVLYYPGELHPFMPGEEIMFRRPSEIGKERQSLDSMREDDWIGCRFFNREGKLLGWIDGDNTPDGKLPERESIFWLEFLADLVGIVLVERFHY